MYIHMLCVYICVCVYIYIYMLIYVCIYIYIYIHTHDSACCPGELTKASAQEAMGYMC